MVFSSITFLFYFLPLFLGLYFLLPWKNMTLLVASLFFYAWGELAYSLVLLLSITLNYIAGLVIGKFGGRRRKIGLSLGILANLGLLAYFKYAHFLASQILPDNDWSAPHLPLGLSFFTFQAISYLVDIHRKDALVERNFLKLGLYIAMFPQLIAGPIIRFKSIADQISSRLISIEKINDGIRYFIGGLAQKVLIANTLAAPADTVFSLPNDQLSMSVAWFGTLCYTLQIYHDFAGYSAMAIGLGLVMGFHFPRNFAHPYIAQSITEFWRRWHISLSRWFRDYLYIPLGGNRRAPMRTYLNLFIVFALCGLWHGASWTFIIWGIYHGLFLILERLCLIHFLPTLPRPLRHVYSLLIVMFGWVIFRSESVTQLQQFASILFGITGPESNPSTLISLTSNSVLAALFIGIMFSMPGLDLLKRYSKAYSHKTVTTPRAWIGAAYDTIYLAIFLVAAAWLANGTYNPFIYFRF